MSLKYTPMRGVNLGGWLVLEPWITPSLFSGTGCLDEYQLCEKLGHEAASILNEFRNNFISKKDFKWIADQGLNAVRLPIGYWVLQGQYPYINTMDYVDKAMQWAREYDLALIISLHGAPGSQNGKNHSGKVGKIGWHKNQANIQLTLDITVLLANRYKDNPSYAGIELLNEPHWKIPRRLLGSYYKQAYQLNREIAGEKLAVIINDHYKPGFWKKFSEKNGYENIFIDRHIYQAYKRDSRRDLASLLKRTAIWASRIVKAQKHLPVIIGEWSLALHQGSRAIKEEGREKVMPAYYEAQIKAFSEAAAWFYWTYKTESPGPWNFRVCVEKGWIKI